MSTVKSSSWSPVRKKATFADRHRLVTNQRPSGLTVTRWLETPASTVSTSWRRGTSITDSVPSPTLLVNSLPPPGAMAKKCVLLDPVGMRPMMDCSSGSTTRMACSCSAVT